jgi:Flp pilus assembly protein TadD
MEREPWNVTFHINVGMSLAAAGRMEEAADMARSAARLDPDAVNVWEFNANVLREIGDVRGAAAARQRLEELRQR